MNKHGKERLDVRVVHSGLAPSREQAQRMIMAGVILVNGHPHTKAGERIGEDAVIESRQSPPFVSRGGEKLEAAFEAFPLCVHGLTCLDVGASTGGFTDCLLQHGAARVIALDVGHGQLDWTLRQDPRVDVMERVNARYLTREALPAEPEFATFDVSFISLRQVMPPVVELLPPVSRVVTLIKPQFEAGRAQVGKGGVVRDPEVRAEVVERIIQFGTKTLGLDLLGVIESPLKGPAGNVEYLALWNKPAKMEYS